MTKETNWEQQNQETPKRKQEKTKINTENNDKFLFIHFGRNALFCMLNTKVTFFVCKIVAN